MSVEDNTNDEKNGSVSEESKRIALAYLKAGGDGDADTAVNLFSPNAQCWVSGPPTYGRVLSREEYFGAFTAFTAEVSGDDIRNVVHQVIAEENRVSVQAESFVRLKNGKLYNNHYHLYFEIDGGQIVVLKEYHDTHHFWECFNGEHSLLGQPTRGTNGF